MRTSHLIENKKSVPHEFDGVARRYDLATSFSQGYQKDLQLSVDRMNLKGDEYIADLCCGTGKSTKACLKNLQSGKVLAVDNSKVMLEVARSKLNFNNVSFIQADVMELDYPENSFDAIFMAYGIRNMPDYEKCLENLRRMLKPGGIICFHEYSLNEGIFSKLYWRFMGYFIIIPVSTLISGSSGIFRYLIKSVLDFPSPNEFIDLLKKNGFKDAKKISMPSWRGPILHTFLAHK